MQRLQQAFRERPWLRRRRVWGTAVLVVVLIGLVTAIDLHLSNRRLIAQRATLSMLMAMNRLEVQIAVLRTQIAREASWDRIYREAQKAGLQEVTPADVEFVPVPGGLEESHPPQSISVRASTPEWTRPEYRESLLEWLLDTLLLRGG